MKNWNYIPVGDEKDQDMNLVSEILKVGEGEETK